MTKLQDFTNPSINGEIIKNREYQEYYTRVNFTELTVNLTENKKLGVKLYNAKFTMSLFDHDNKERIK